MSGINKKMEVLIEDITSSSSSSSDSDSSTETETYEYNDTILLHPSTVPYKKCSSNLIESIEKMNKLIKKKQNVIKITNQLENVMNEIDHYLQSVRETIEKMNVRT